MSQPGRNREPEDSKEKPASSKERDSNLDGIISELKDVLAELAKEEAAPPSQEFIPEQNPPGPIKPLPEAPPLGPSNGSDFWEGNVLGWPPFSGADQAPLPPTPVPQEPPAPLPPAPPPPSPPATQPIAIELTDAGSNRDIQPGSHSEVGTPAPIVPTFSIPDIPSIGVDNAKPGNAFPDPFGLFPSGEEPGQAPAVMDKPSTPAEEPTLLIPGSLDDAKKPPADGKDKNYGDVTLPKPEHLIQIACIYPEGEEKAGQQFVTRLRALAEKSATPLDVQAVFICPWRPENPDVGAWSKSSILAGADMMFVLVPKANQGQLKNMSLEATAAGIRSRAVFLEHVNLRSAYADVLIHLKRKS